MSASSTELFDAVRKCLVSLDWGLSSSATDQQQQQQQDVPFDVLFDMILCGVPQITQASSQQAPTSSSALGHVLSRVGYGGSARQFSDTFFAVVLFATSYLASVQKNKSQSRSPSTAAFDLTFRDAYGLRSPSSPSPSHVSPDAMGGPANLTEASRRLLNNALSAMPPSADPVWRRPALLAAIESLASMVWECQTRVHHRAAASTNTNSKNNSSVASEEIARSDVLCPVCAAVATRNEIAVDALEALLVYASLLNNEAEQRDVHAQAQRHVEALLRTAVWNGHAALARRLFVVWWPQFIAHSDALLWLAHTRSQDTTVDETAEAQAEQDMCAREEEALMRVYFRYVQDEATLHGASDHTRREFDVAASLVALHALCRTPRQQIHLVQWCLTLPLLWLRGDTVCGEGSVSEARASAQASAPSLTLLAWLVKSRYEAAARLVLNWVIVCVAPSWQSETSVTGPHPAPASVEPQGTQPAKPMAAGHDDEDEDEAVTAPCRPPLRIDFHQLAAAQVSSSPAPPASSSSGQQNAPQGTKQASPLPPPSWTAYGKAAHTVLFALNATCAIADTTHGGASDSAAPASPLDLAVWSGQGSLVRLLLAVGASASAVHPVALEQLLNARNGADDERKHLSQDLDSPRDAAEKEEEKAEEARDFLRLLCAPERHDGNELVSSQSLLQQLSSCVYTTSRARLLASLAAKLWQQKVCHLQAPSDAAGDAPPSASSASGKRWLAHLLAQDRVLRPALAAMELDPFEPLARLTLIQVLSRKLQDGLPRLAELWARCDGNENSIDHDSDATMAARRWLCYYGTVWRLLTTLTVTAVGRQVLARAVQGRGLLDHYAEDTHRACVRARLRAMSLPHESCDEAWQPPSDTAPRANSSLFRTVTAESRAVVRAVVHQAAQRCLHDEETTAPSHAPSPLAAQVLRSRSEKGCFVRVHCSAGFLASAGTGAAAFLTPHGALPSSHTLSCDVWLHVPVIIDLAASLAQTGGCVGVVVHDLPLSAPLVKGDLILFVCRPVTSLHENESGASGATTLEAVQRISCREPHHPRELRLPCVLAAAQPEHTHADARGGNRAVVSLHVLAVLQPSTLASYAPERVFVGTNPMDWLDTRAAAEQQAKTHATVPSSSARLAPVGVLSTLHDAPQLAERWQRAALVGCSPCWVYMLTESNETASPLPSSATPAGDGNWFAWHEDTCTIGAIPTRTQRLARPLIEPMSSKDNMTPSPSLVYVLERVEATNAQDPQMELVGVLPASV